MSNQSIWSIDELQEAWQMATKLHDGQKYGGQQQGEQIEYLNHIGSVVFEILSAVNADQGMDAELAIKCAILHDTVEDTAFSYERVKSKYGEKVADGVLALTKNNQIDGAENKMLDSLARIKKQPKEVWAVKMADRICNLQGPPFYWTNEKKQAYWEEARVILHELKEGNRYLAERLERKIQEYRKFFSGDRE